MTNRASLTNQPTDAQISYLGSIWHLNRDWEICERAARVLGRGNKYARNGKLTGADIETVIKAALEKRGLRDTRYDAGDIDSL